MLRLPGKLIFYPLCISFFHTTPQSFAYHIIIIREALVALARLGAKTANPSNTAAYLKGLVEKSSGLFSNSAGEQGSIEATANALQALEVLGELNQKWVTDLFGGIKDALRKSFNGDSFGTDLRTNYFSTIAASIVGFEFAHAKLAKFIVDLQSPQGLFYSDSAKLSTSLEATADAMLTLYLLDKATHQAGTFVERYYPHIIYIIVY